jgi:hypothetical protein
MIRTTAPRRLARIMRVIQRMPHPLRHGLEHGQVDVCALARTLARVKSRENRRVSVQPGTDVSNGNSYLGRRLRGTRQRQHPCLALHQQVIGFFL